MVLEELLNTVMGTSLACFSPIAFAHSAMKLTIEF